MKKATSFSETQKFDQWWVWAIVLLLPLVFLFFLIKEWDSFDFRSSYMGAKEWFFILIFILTIVSSFFLRLLNLQTRIDEKGISVRFFPIHRKFKFIPWNQIQQAYIRKYSPIMEYGGWGLRFSHKGTAYNVKGNMGLQLKIEKGGRTKSLLIGTQKPERMQRVLNELEM